MNCPNCGAPWKEGMAFCTRCGSAKPVLQEEPVLQEQPVFQEQPVIQEQPAFDYPMSQAKPHKKKPAGKLWLRIASVVLCIFLTLSLLVTAAVLDLRRITSEKQLEKTVEVILTPQKTSIKLLALTVPGADGATDVEISADLSTDDLVDLVYDEMKKEYGDELNVSRSQLKRFVEKSTLKEWVAEKVAGYTSDLLRGTEDTRITTGEVKKLIRENRSLIESTFDVEVDDQMIQDVLDFVNVEEVNTTIREQVMDEIANADVGGVPLKELLEEVQNITSGGMLWLMIGVNLLLVLLLVLTNWGRVASCLRCIAIPALVAGALLSIPTLLVQLLMQGSSVVEVLIRTIISGFALVHYGMLGVGVLLLVASVLTGILVKPKK